MIDKILDSDLEHKKGIPRGFRLQTNIDNVAEYLRQSMGMNRSQFYELAIIEFITNVNIDLTFEGVDFKEYCKILKLEKLRIVEIKKRVEIKSRHLFVHKVEKNILLYLAKGKNKKQIYELLEQFKKEAKHYKNDEALKEVEQLIEQGKKDNWHTLKQRINEELDTNYYNKIGFRK